MMRFFNNLFNRKNPNVMMQPLYDAAVKEGRRIEWYENGKVPDTVDGRFDMIVAILAIIFMRLEKEHDKADEYVWLSELFVSDMDGQLRQIGIGDMVVGKHITRMMGAVGGRLSAYTSALEGSENLKDALSRNLYRGAPPEEEAVEYVAAKLTQFHKELKDSDISNILSGKLPESI